MSIFKCFHFKVNFGELIHCKHVVRVKAYSNLPDAFCFITLVSVSILIRFIFSLALSSSVVCNGLIALAGLAFVSQL